MSKKVWVLKGINPDTGKKYFNLEKPVKPLGLVEPPTIDELPIPGTEGIQLSKENPQPGVQTETSSANVSPGKKERWFPTFIELGQTKHDKEG